MLSDYNDFVKAAETLANCKGAFQDKATLSRIYGLPPSWCTQCYTKDYVVGMVPMTVSEAKRWAGDADCATDALALIGGGSILSLMSAQTTAYDTHTCLLILAADWCGRLAASVATYDYLYGVLSVTGPTWAQRLGRLFESISCGKCELQYNKESALKQGFSLSIGNFPTTDSYLRFPLSFVVRSPSEEACQAFHLALSSFLGASSVTLRRALIEAEKEILRLREAVAYESSKARDAMSYGVGAAPSASSEPPWTRGLRSEGNANGRSVTPPPTRGGEANPPPASPPVGGPSTVPVNNAPIRAALRAQVESGGKTRGRGRGVRIGM